MLVLVIEDHRLLAETVMDFLNLENIHTDYAADGRRGLALATAQHYDAIVLDVNLPGMDGYEVATQIRAQGHDTPIVMLTARDALEDKLEGFARGADDYLVKPFAPPELLARITALVKRQRGEIANKRLVLGSITLDPAQRQVWRNEQIVELSPTGFRILRILMRESPAIVARDSIESELWGDDVPDSDVLRSHVYNLRKVLDHPYEQAAIRTVKGAGFRFVAPTV